MKAASTTGNGLAGQTVSATRASGTTAPGIIVQHTSGGGPGLSGTSISAKTALLFALFSMITGLSFCAGHVSGWRAFGQSYTPLVYDAGMVRGIGSPSYFHAFDHVAWDETSAYARYVHEILRGEWLGATPAVYNRYASGPLPSGSPFFRDRLGPALLALLSIPFGRDVSKAFIAADFIFPALLALVLLALCRRLLPTISWQLLAAAAAIWFNLSDVTGLLYLYWGAPHYGPIFARTAYPQISFILFVLFLLAMLRLRERPSSRSAALLTATLLLNFYSYVYSWTLAIAMIGAWFCLSILPERWPARAALQPSRIRPRGELRLLMSSTAVAIALAFPVWLPLLRRDAALHDFFIRLGGNSTRQPDLLSIVFCSLLAALALWAGRAGWPHAWFWAAFWLASLAVYNQQVFTGREMQPFHYLSFFIGPLLPLFLCDLGAWRLNNAALGAEGWQLAGRALVLAAVIAGFAQCVFRLSQPVPGERDFHTVDSNFQQVLDLLREPLYGQYGFLTNDAFLDQALPAFIPQKGLQAWWMDPLSNHEMGVLHSAAAQILGEPAHAAAGFRFDPVLVILVLNRHRPIHANIATCQVLLSNTDFLLVKAGPCN